MVTSQGKMPADSCGLQGRMLGGTFPVYCVRSMANHQQTRKPQGVSSGPKRGRGVGEARVGMRGRRNDPRSSPNFRVQLVYQLG